MIINDTVLNIIHSPVRRIEAAANTSGGTFRSINNLKGFTLERIGDSTKFFGFGVCQKLNLHIRDIDRSLSFSAGGTIRLFMYPPDEMALRTAIGASAATYLYITEVHRDENTNELSITAYDSIYKASSHYYSEAQNTVEAASILDIANSCCAVLGTSLTFDTTNESLVNAFNMVTIPNLEGTETIREVLDDIAEATQTIYYCGGNSDIVFRRLDKDGEPVYTIDKHKYFTLDSKTNRRLSGLCRATELGDNVSVSMTEIGTTQYIRNNAFWDTFDGAELETILNNALEVVGGLTINQFNCSWRGNWLLEIGDKIGLETKDGNIVYSYFLNDTITYNGGYQQITRWEYANSEEETADNPATLGDALKKTYAKVDKVNKEIELVVSTVENTAEEVSTIKLTTDGMSATVQSVESNINDVTQELEELTERVATTVTPEQLQIQIQEALKTDVTEVTTITGFTFNENGLNVSKSGSEMNTQITENGMTVYREYSPMLVANNEGVEAINLKASTFLIIGDNSRLEDYKNRTRTGCFWIGG